MARHVCHECGATVTGDEQFCPTCGTFLGYQEELDQETDFEQFELGEGPPASEPGRTPAQVVCPSCGFENAATNRHCEECGARLSQGPLPAAPRPAVQATAGVRAVIAIGGLLLGVILIALIFQIFSDDETATTSSGPVAEGTSTTPPQAEVEVLEPLDVECSVEGLGSFVCQNLISGSDALYQVKWPDLVTAGETLRITIRFRTAVMITRIDWHNITGDDTRWRRNFRARSLTISADDSFSDVQADLENVPGVQEIIFASNNTNQVTITVQSAWDAEIVEDNVFTELAIDEIEVLGRPVTATTSGGTTGSTSATSSSSSSTSSTTP